MRCHSLLLERKRIRGRLLCRLDSVWVLRRLYLQLRIRWDHLRQRQDAVYADREHRHEWNLLRDHVHLMESGGLRSYSYLYRPNVWHRHRLGPNPHARVLYLSSKERRGEAFL